MPSEPDNGKMEELLKAYAKKRREQASGSFELHPAVRKMLQGEVARQKGGSRPEGLNLAGLLFRWIPRVALVGAAVMVLSLVLWNVSQPPTFDKVASANVQNERGAESKSRENWAFDGGAPAAPAATAPAKDAISLQDSYSDQLKKGSERDVRLQTENRGLAYQNEGLPQEAAKKPSEPQPLPVIKESNEKRASRARAPVAQKSMDELEVARQAGQPQLRDLDSVTRAKNDKDAKAGILDGSSTTVLSRSEPAFAAPQEKQL